MKLNIFNSNKHVILDGGMGTMLQATGLKNIHSETVAITNPDILEQIHKAYVDAGSNIICASTFGANPKKMLTMGYSLEQAISASLFVAKKACAGTKTLVAIDVGPLGELLEPNGSLSFESAYDMFKEIAILGEKHGADIIYFETMTDLYELKAAVLAAKENTSLPVFASMSFEKNGRTFTGCTVLSMAKTISGLGVDALGINCSLGPVEILPIATELCSVTSLPVLIKANAGLPDPENGDYAIGAEQFAKDMQPYIGIGINAVGGCCGTTPEFIKQVFKTFGNIPVKKRKPTNQSIICSPTVSKEINQPLIVGERINPTSKRELQKALLAEDMSAVTALAVSQMQCGADILDINVGIPSADEVSLMIQAVKAVQAVCPLPLIIDSTNPEVLQAGLRVYNGKPIANSVSAKKESLDAILPICKKYGAGVIGLCIDDEGIPKTAADRLKIARFIVKQALVAGIAREDIYIDCLALTASAEQDAVYETLNAIRLVKSELGVKTILGISNISFGLPNRESLNTAFLTLAVEYGLDLAIMNPQYSSMTDAISAFKLLKGYDIKAKDYIARFSSTNKKSSLNSDGCYSLKDAILLGLTKEASDFAALELESKSCLDIISSTLVPALDEVGIKYELGEYFLPQLLQSATAAQSAFEIIKSRMPKSNTPNDEKTIIVATVLGDIHDIGKNIVSSILSNYGYNVVDLGKDVPIETVVSHAQKTKCKLVGLSALMTTTVPAMQQTVEAIKSANLSCKIMVGGAVVTEDYAKKIGADYYAKDAKASVDIAKIIFSN